VDYHLCDFNGAARYFSSHGADEWADIAHVVSEMVLQLQPSDQAGRGRSPIFDPKATNAYLTNALHSLGWQKVPVPAGLTEFGLDWDAGKNGTLAEFQFSNYPFLWNNTIRSEGVFTARTLLAGVGEVEALIVITKSGLFPASNSTLYYEQAVAQISAATNFNAFRIPIRLVGLTLAEGTALVEADWNEYPARYGRVVELTTRRAFAVTWGRVRKHGYQGVKFTAAD
jgi:hypothetical protein